MGIQEVGAYHVRMADCESCKEFIHRKNAQFEHELKASKAVSMKDIGRKGRHKFVREAWTFMQQYNLPEKVFIIERLRKVGIDGRVVHKRTQKNGEIEYRIGYFIVGKIGFMRGKWAWGQFCPLIPATDLKKLLKKAEREGTIKWPDPL